MSTGILKNRGISVAISLLAALALVLSTMAPLFPTGKIKPAFAAAGGVCKSAAGLASPILSNSTGTAMVISVNSGSTTTLRIYTDDGVDGSTDRLVVSRGTVNGNAAGTNNFLSAVATTAVCTAPPFGFSEAGADIATPIDAYNQFVFVAPTLASGSTGMLVQFQFDGNSDGDFIDSNVDATYFLTVVPIAGSLVVATPVPTTILANGTVNSAITVTVRDNSGNPLAGTAIGVVTSLGAFNKTDQICLVAAGFNLSRPDNACTTVGTNALGVTTVQLFGSGSPGVATVTFTLGSITASRTVTLTGTPAGLVLDGARQTGAGLGYIAKDIVRGSQSGGTAEDELYVVANVNDINGNPVAGPTVIVTLTGRNAANAIQSFWSAGGPENLPGIGGGAYCDVSVGPTCVDLAQAGSGSAGRAAAVGYIDIDAATPSGTYTVTGSCLCGPGGAEITGTYSFKIAQKPSVIVVTGPGALFVGANDSATATITDVDGAVVADGTAILWSSSTAFLLLQTAGGAVATTGLGTTTTNGVITITLIAVGPGVAQVVANYGTLVNNNLRVIVSSASDGSGGALAVTPNSPYVAGLNSIVVQGGGTPAAVAVVIATASGLTVTVIWVFSTGQWVFFLPATPAIAGGLTTFPGPLASAFVGLG